MLKTNLKSKLRKNQLLIGSWITIGNESIAEIMAHQNFDWLVIDLEHSAINIAQMQNLIRVIELSQCPALVRVSENDPTLIKRVMDAGAQGVIVPMINNPEQAEAAVRAVRYPPEGGRGVGLSRAQGYGVSFLEYKKWQDNESVVIVQIEHIDAVKNLEAILKVPGVDAFLVGPYDLSASIGVPGQFTHPEMKANIKKIISLAKKLKVSAGFHVIAPDYKEVAQRIKEGYKFISFSLDSLILARACENGLKALKKFRKT